jgi:hypothetical protein
MFVFVFVGALFKLSAKRPALAPLFQLPPAIAPRARKATTDFFQVGWIEAPIFSEKAYSGLLLKSDSLKLPLEAYPIFRQIDVRLVRENAFHFLV